jgi:hypothetical protein
MDSLSRPWRLAFFALAGCTPSLPDGLPPSLYQTYASCDGMASPARDWCKASAVAKHEMQISSGALLAEVCLTLEEVGARDKCLMQASRMTPSPPPSACEAVENERMRASCFFDLADTIARQATTMEGLVGACDPLPQHRDQCYAHFIQRSSPSWCEGGDATRLEVAELLKRFVPDLHEMEPVGTAFAEADTNCPQAGVRLCSTLAPGAASDACLRFKPGGAPPPPP